MEKSISMERQVGEEFDVKIRVRTVESSCELPCSICALSGVCNSDYAEKVSTCFPTTRIDGKNIYYELVSYDEV